MVLKTKYEHVCFFVARVHYGTTVDQIVSVVSCHQDLLFLKKRIEKYQEHCLYNN
jgi:hypothetical protein